MRIKSPIIATTILVGMATSALAADQKGECHLSAFTAYNKANLAILATANPILKAEVQIAKRRLQEQYCSRVAQCESGDVPAQQTTMTFDVMFSKCLSDEAQEECELIPKNN